jgi:hypothetical protein
MLAADPTPSSEEIETQLFDIRRNEGAQYYTIRLRLADVLARRIETLQTAAPEEARELLALGQKVFAGSSAIDALTPIDAVAQEKLRHPIGENTQESTARE